MSPHVRALLSCAFLLATTALSWAHNPFENTAIATLHPDRLEIRLTMGLTTARTIYANGEWVDPVDRSTLPAVRQNLLTSAAALFEITSAGSPLVLSKVEVKIDEEDEVVYSFVYPRPRPGTLRVRAAHVSKQPYGGTYFTLQNEAGQELVTSLLMAEELTQETVIAAPPAKAAPAQPK